MTDYGSSEPETKKPRKSAAGRQLVRWDADLDQFVLLALDNVCARLGVAIPWDAVGDEVGAALGKKVTSEAIKQHLAKLYKFRETYGHLVPQKVDVSQRRRAAAAAGVTTPQGGRRGRKDDDAPPPAPAKPGASLLPPKRLTKAPTKKSKMDAPLKLKLSSTGRGRSKIVKQETEDEDIAVKQEHDSDDEVVKPRTKRAGGAPRGSKRARKQRDNHDQEEAEDSEFETPIKRQKTDTYLRPRAVPNYAPQLEFDDEDEQAFDDKAPLASTKYQNMRRGQDSFQESQSFGDQAPSQFAPSHINGYENCPPGMTSSYSNNGSDGISPTDDSSNDYTHVRNGSATGGYDNFSSPMMSNSAQNSYHALNAGIPPFGGNFNSLQDAPQKDFMGSQYNNYMHDDAAVHKTDNEIEQDGPPNSNINFATDASQSLPACDQSLNLDSDNKLHLETKLNNCGFGLDGQQTTSPDGFGYGNGETGITPAMAQTGFHHNDSFDSGYGGDITDPIERHPQFFGTDFFDAEDGLVFD